MNTSLLTQNQLLITKFYVPISSGSLISRPRLTTLLDENRKYPLTLVSAAAGFGKTTLLSTWVQSLQAKGPQVAWVSLDEEDNDPRLFWTYVLTALNKQLPERFTSLVTLLQSPQSPPVGTLLAKLINLLVEGTETFVLILDDYHVITEQQVHTTLAHLIEHLPPQLRIIMATRADPPLPLARLRARKQVLEVRTDQFRCTSEETRAFLDEVMTIHLPDETIQQVTTRTEGWLVGLQLLGLSLPDRVNPEKLVKEIHGDQCYILDFLTEEVLRRQSQDVQTFLLSTCVLEQLSAPLCDAVTELKNSQHLLQQIEQANLFVVCLDHRQQWYRYHTLFAEALHHHLEQTRPDLLPGLHQRASLWYTQHQQTTQATLHAFKAREWQRAADLIEQQFLPLVSQTWGASHHSSAKLYKWLKQLPVEVTHARPQLCLASATLLYQTAPYPLLEGWLDVAEAALTASLTTEVRTHVSPIIPVSQIRLEQENLLGAVVTFRAVLKTYSKEGLAALPLCQQALGLVSADNVILRAMNFWIECMTYYHSETNDAVTAVEKGLQAVLLARTADQTKLAITLIGTVAMYMIGSGRLREASRLSQQGKALGTQQGGLVLPEVGRPTVSQIEVLREHNKLDAALSLTRETISLCHQSESMLSLVDVLYGYAMLLRVSLSRGDLIEACSALQQFEALRRLVNQPLYFAVRSIYTTVDQVRLWLACGELSRALQWAEQSKIGEQDVTALELERQEVARVRTLLALDQPAQALHLLEPVLQRVTTGKRWGHVIEIRILQALAHQMLHRQTQALSTLSEAVRLAEPEGYIRSFLDEGVPIEALLYHLRRRDRNDGPTPYLDTLLATFQQESRARAQAEERTRAQALPEPLSERELQVLQLLTEGTSNQEIAQELIIAYDTVKRHVSHIFSKLGVTNRVQAVRQARELGLLDEEV